MQSKLTCRALSAHTLSFLLNTFNDNTVTTQMGEYSYPVAQDLKHKRTSFHRMQTYHHLNGIDIVGSISHGSYGIEVSTVEEEEVLNFFGRVLKIKLRS